MNEFIPEELLIRISKLRGDEEQSILMINELMLSGTTIDKSAASMIFNQLIKETDSPNGIWHKVIDCNGFSELFDGYDDGSYWVRTREIGAIAELIKNLPKLTVDSNKYVSNLHLMKYNKIMSLEHINIRDYLKLEYFTQLDTLVSFALENPDQVKPEDYSIWLHSCELIKYDQQVFLDTISEGDIFNYVDIDWWIESELCSSVQHITWFLRKFDNTNKASKFTTQNHRFHYLIQKLNEYSLFPEDVQPILFQIVFEHGNGGDLIINLSLNTTQNVLTLDCLEHVYENYPEYWNKLTSLMSVSLTCTKSNNTTLQEVSIYTMRKHLVFLTGDGLRDQLRNICDYDKNLLVHYKQFIILYYSIPKVFENLNMFGPNTAEIINMLDITPDILPYVEGTNFWKELL